MARPLCFVLMPFGRKPDSQSKVIDFDAVYEELIQPAVAAAELDPIRADEELTGGIIHKTMFERLILCPFAIADLTLANANVFYELGVRHAIRPHTPVAVFAEGTRLPFDVTMLRAVPYRLPIEGATAELERYKHAVTKMLQGARQDARDDSPVSQLSKTSPGENKPTSCHASRRTPSAIEFGMRRNARKNWRGRGGQVSTTSNGWSETFLRRPKAAGEVRISWILQW